MNNGMSDTMGDGFLRVFVDGRAMDDMWYAADTSEIKEHGRNVAKILFNLMENGILANFEVTAFKDSSREPVAKFTPDDIEETYDQYYT